MSEYIKVPNGTCRRCRGMGSDPTDGNDVPCWDCGGTGKRRSVEPRPEGGYYFDEGLGVVIGPDLKGTASTPEEALRDAGKDLDYGLGIPNEATRENYYLKFCRENKLDPEDSKSSIAYEQDFAPGWDEGDWDCLNDEEREAVYGDERDRP